MRGLYDITEGLCQIFALQQQCRLLLVKINFVQRDAFKVQQVSVVKYSAAVKFTGKGFLCKVLILIISIESLSSSCRRLQLGKCNYPSVNQNGNLSGQESQSGLFFFYVRQDAALSGSSCSSITSSSLHPSDWLMRPLIQPTGSEFRPSGRSLVHSQSAAEYHCECNSESWRRCAPQGDRVLNHVLH